MDKTYRAEICRSQSNDHYIVSFYEGDQVHPFTVRPDPIVRGFLEKNVVAGGLAITFTMRGARRIARKGLAALYAGHVEPLHPTKLETIK